MTLQICGRKNNHIVRYNHITLKRILYIIVIAVE